MTVFPSLAAGARHAIAWTRRGVAGSALAALVACAGAFSPAGHGPATAPADARPAAPVAAAPGSEVTLPPPVVPAPMLDTAAVTLSPLVSVPPPVPEAPVATPVTILPRAVPSTSGAASVAIPGIPGLVLLLPLDSQIYGRAAEAVLAGFRVAADQSGTAFKIIPHREGGVVAAAMQAKASGARIIVGPLVRDDLRDLVDSASDLPVTLALNQLEEGIPLLPRLYTLALSVEGEGRQLGRLIRDEGARTVAVVASESALQQRFVASFLDEWIMQGGGPPLVLKFERSPEALAGLRQRLAGAAPDAVLLAVDGLDAASAKPYLGHAPVYTSSLVNDRPPLEMIHDLDNIRFLEIPWLVAPDDEAFAPYLPRPYLANAALDRLYALGIDAFHVALAFRNGPARLDLEGATGRLTLTGGRQITRDARLVRFLDGRLIAVDRAP